MEPYRFYGDGGTIHGSTQLDVETHKGEVVAVWFRCSTVPFEQYEVDRDRAHEMRAANRHQVALHGLVLRDPDLTDE